MHKELSKLLCKYRCKYQMKVGGESDPRNKTLMKIFNLIGIGERAGSGVPELFSVWEDEGWEEPVIKESFNPDRTVLKLALKKVQIKNAENKCQKKVREKTYKQYEVILSVMESDKWYQTTDFIEILNVKERRIQRILKELVQKGDLVDNGVIKGKDIKKCKIYTFYNVANLYQKMHF